MRPCAERFQGKTFLGVLLGTVALSFGVSWNRKTEVLQVKAGHHNPAIWVPARKEVVLGAGSWWGVIDSPAKLQALSDEDIGRVWYVRALRELEGGPVEEEGDVAVPTPDFAAMSASLRLYADSLGEKQVDDGLGAPYIQDLAERLDELSAGTGGEL